MKQLHIFKKGTPQGDVDIKMQIKGKLIAIASNGMNPYARQFVSQYKAKGAKVIETRKAVIVNIFPEGKTVFKLGQVEIDFEQDSEEIVENKICQFYIETYSKAGFNIE